MTVSILFLAAEPTDGEVRLRISEELREIDEKLRLSCMRDYFALYQRLAVRPVDISQALLDFSPSIVHFSGHATSQGALCVEDLTGQKHPIEPDALAALFQQFSDKVKCVILNACYAEVQAHAIAQYIDYVIGTNRTISDGAAIAFSIGFYQALAAGRSVKAAFQLGCVQIRLQGLPEHLMPVLVVRSGVDPDAGDQNLLGALHRRPSERRQTSSRRRAVITLPSGRRAEFDIPSLYLKLEEAAIFAARFDYRNASSLLYDLLVNIQLLPDYTDVVYLRAETLTQLANIARDSGKITGARGAQSLYQQAIQLWSQLNQEDKVAQITWFLAVCHEMRREYPKALEYYQAALRIMESSNQPMNVLRGRVLLRLGSFFTKVGEMSKAQRVVLESIRLIEEVDSPSFYSLSQQKLAIVFRGQGKIDKACVTAEKSLSHIPSTDYLRLVQGKILFADILLGIGEEDAALDYAADAERISHRFGFNHQLRALNMVIGRHLR